MVFADKVMDSSGSPTVWITEDLDQDPEDHAPASIRVVWKVIRVNCMMVQVKAEAVHRIFDGCKNGRSHAIPDSVPEDHLEELRMKIQLDMLDTVSRETTVVFPQFDIEHTVDPEPVQEGEA